MMHTAKRGSRVELVRTSDPHTLLRRGARGTVTSAQSSEMGTAVHVAWDSGSTLTMLLEEGDVIKTLCPTTPHGLTECSGWRNEGHHSECPGRSHDG